MKDYNKLMIKEYSKPVKNTIRITRLIFLALPVVFALTGCAMMGSGKDTGNYLAPSHEVKKYEDQLQPGLSVLYFHAFYRHIDEMPRGRIAIARGIPGKPIPYLDHHFAEEVMVFESGRAKGVGMHLEGYILLEKPGEYVFQANSNDGFRMLISDRRIINDPTVHSDRLSEKGMVKISEPGWYPIHILYFQRKGTATIQLFWKKPGDKQKSIVPAEVYAHLPVER